MKQALRIGILLGIFALSTQASAGVQKFNSNEFNDIISENLKAEQDLREQLRVNAGVPDMKKEMNPDFAEKGREIVGVAAAENIAAPTTNHGHHGRRDDAEKRVQQGNLQRISQEVQELDGP